MLHLLTSPSTRRTLRAALGTVSAAVRSVVAPATLVEQLAAEAPAAAETAEAPEPAGLFTADNMPTPAAIAAAALGYDLASDNARSADRSKRKHRKLLDRLESGLYGEWSISRKASNRQAVDLAAVTAFYRQHGKTVPMKPCAASLVVERIEVPAVAELVAA